MTSVIFIYAIVTILMTNACASPADTVYESQAYTDEEIVRVNKCCEEHEILVGSRCTHVNETDFNVWRPIFTSADGKRDNIQIKNFKFAIGLPVCSTTQQWQVYHYQNSIDKLLLLPSGTLRHYIHHETPEDVEAEPVEGQEPRYYDYAPGHYCLDKRIDQNGTLISQYALICTPEIVSSWTDTNFLLKKVIDPVFHIFALICYMFIAVVYFVMPTLRDLMGNIVTTIALCYAVSTTAEFVRIFTELGNHYSFIVADIFVYFSILGAFFWLNSMGYYIWKMFKSRNVFLRVTDGKKYCYYSFYAWGSTLTLACVALFAHFMFERMDSEQKSFLHGQKTIGYLGVAVFFTPIACLISINIAFYVITQNIINRRHTYGRIHHKLIHGFRMFALLFVVMSVNWLILLLTWLNYDPIYYTYIIVNFLQAPLILYICVFNQKHVSYLLRKSCCYAHCWCSRCRPEPNCAAPGEWGDEMQAMETGIY